VCLVLIFAVFVLVLCVSFVFICVCLRVVDICVSVCVGNPKYSKQIDEEKKAKSG